MVHISLRGSQKTTFGGGESVQVDLGYVCCSCPHPLHTHPLLVHDGAGVRREMGRPQAGAKV